MVNQLGVDLQDITIKQVDLRTLTDEEIAKFNTFTNLLLAESHPEDPPTPLAQSIAALRNIPDFYKLTSFVAIDTNGTIVASAEAGYADTDDNKHLVECGVYVLPEYRRRGLAKELLKGTVTFVENANRTLVLGGTSERVPSGNEFVKRIDAELGSREHINRLLLADVDNEMVDRWITEGPTRAPGYSLLWFDGRWPDDRVQELVDCVHVMNTAPRDDLDIEDFVFTVEQFRQQEQSMLARDIERWSVFAQHDESGKFAGYTEVVWTPHKPKIIGQQGTGVSPEHRGHALGKWLKAVMVRRILDERPEAFDIRTGNADSNDAMLGINNALGFKPYFGAATWQISIDKLKAYVNS